MLSTCSLLPSSILEHLEFQIKLQTVSENMSYHYTWFYELCMLCCYLKWTWTSSLTPKSFKCLFAKSKLVLFLRKGPNLKRHMSLNIKSINWTDPPLLECCHHPKTVSKICLAFLPIKSVNDGFYLREAAGFSPSALENHRCYQPWSRLEPAANQHLSSSSW